MFQDLVTLQRIECGEDAEYATLAFRPSEGSGLWNEKHLLRVPMGVARELCIGDVLTLTLVR